MERRKFVLDTFKTIPLVLLVPNLLTSCSKEDMSTTNNGKTVIVIGAGISGLAAAKKLKDKGFNVIVIEAQEKIGGRIRTDRSLGMAFDEGASWIHGSKGNPITNLVSQAGANTYMTDDDSLKVFDNNGTAYSDTFLDAQYTQFEKALNAVRSAGIKTQSFQDVFNSLYPTLENNRLWKYMLSAYLEFDTGGDISQLSSKYFDDDEAFSGTDVIVINGYDKIANVLGDGLNIRLNSRVTEINYTATKSLVKVNGDSIEADYVIVSVPLGVLKKNSIAFTPILPTAKLSAIQNTKMGNVNKFLFIWKTPFWETNVQYIGYTPDTKGKFNYFMNMLKFLPTTNSLMTFAYGDYASVTETMNDAQVINEVMAQLKAIYGTGIPNPTNMLRTKWGQNINTFGSYSFASNDTTSADFDTMAKEISNKLFFAGEHTIRDYRGTVHGAYLSGIREADKIIAL
jgi:monoamine oxidase